MNPDGGYTDVTTRYDSDGIYLCTIAWDYDSNEDLLRRTYSDDSYDREITYLREVDENGHTLRETITGWYGSVTDFTYDENGNCIKAISPVELRDNWDYSNTYWLTQKTWEYTYIPIVLTEEQLRLNKLYPTEESVPSDYPMGQSRYDYYSGLR